MVLPLLDYGDIVWGDKRNKTLMAKFQLLQDKVAKLTLGKAKHSSATEAIGHVRYINILTWLQGFQVKLLYLVLFLLYLIPRSHQSLNMFKSCLVKHGLKLFSL